MQRWRVLDDIAPRTLWQFLLKPAGQCFGLGGECKIAAAPSIVAFATGEFAKLHRNMTKSLNIADTGPPMLTLVQTSSAGLCCAPWPRPLARAWLHRKQ